jgi:hypothetical protein
MSAPAAISGDFATYKHVQGRKMLQLVIEVPAEMASAVFAALGTPGSGEAIPVALARLKPTVSQPETVRTERQPFTEKPYATQAALRCQETAFQMFLIETDRMPDGPVGADGVDRAAYAVRLLCGVESRADIGKGPNDRSTNDSGFKWRALDAEYYAWQRGRR